MKIRFLLSVAVLLASIFTVACGEKSSTPPPLPPLVITQKAVQGDVRAQASFAGEVRARSESALGFRVGGKIIERRVDVGAMVKPGLVLARIDVRDLQLGAAGARSQVAAAQADLTQAQADYGRYSDLYQKKFVSTAEIDRRKATLDVAQARLDQARAQLSVADNQSTYAVLQADRAGVVTAIEAEVGQVVTAGQTVVRVARDAEKEILITVPENRLGEVRAAQKIEVSLWAAPAVRYQGKVREISPSADTVTRTYAVRITVPEADTAMRLGMTASVSLSLANTPDAVVLPLTAVYQQGTSAAVWIVDPATQTVKLVPVAIGVYRDDSVTVRSGIREGDVVVTAGVHKLTAGQKVRIANDASASRSKSP